MTFLPLLNPGEIVLDESVSESMGRKSGKSNDTDPRGTATDAALSF